jgi:hypothetical protein
MIHVTLTFVSNVSTAAVFLDINESLTTRDTYILQG